MAVTLAQAALNTEDDIDRMVIDEFRRSSYLLNAMPFEDAVNPAGGGATLTYGYTRLVTASTAGTRAINSEYTPGEATKQQHTVDLKVLGGAFQIDRVLSELARAAELDFQMRQKIAAASNYWHYLVINGDNAGDATEFDGLDVALTGTSTELDAGTEADWRPSQITSQAQAAAVMAQIEDLLSNVSGQPDALLTNRQGRLALIHIARMAGYKTEGEDAFGRRIASYDGIPIVDLGYYVAGETSTEEPIIPVETRDPDGDATTTDGLTDIYAARFSEDALHAVTLAGVPFIRQWLPDFSTAGAVKTGEVELVAAIALKATRGAAVLRNRRVA